MRFTMLSAQRLRTARLKLGLSQVQLSRRTGIRSDELCHYEAGRRRPSLAALTTLAMVLRLTLDYLAGFDAQTETNHKPKRKKKHGNIPKCSTRN